MRDGAENDLGVRRLGAPIVSAGRYQPRSFPATYDGRRGVFTFERDWDDITGRSSDWFLVFKIPHPVPSTPIGAFFGSIFSGPEPTLRIGAREAAQIFKLMPEVHDEPGRLKSIRPEWEEVASGAAPTTAARTPAFPQVLPNAWGVQRLGDPSAPDDPREPRVFPASLRNREGVFTFERRHDRSGKPSEWCLIFRAPKGAWTAPRAFSEDNFNGPRPNRRITSSSHTELAFALMPELRAELARLSQLSD